MRIELQLYASGVALKTQAIFLTDDITRVLRAVVIIDDDDNEHVLQIARWCYGAAPASLYSVALASFVAQVKSVMFYDLSVSGSGWGDGVYLVRAPYNPCDYNCLDDDDNEHVLQIAPYP